MKEEFDVVVENVVAFTVLNVKVPLGRIVHISENTEYEPEQFPGLVYRINNPRAATLIFSSGKIVCTGTKSIKDAKEAIRKTVDMIEKVGVSTPKNYEVKIENLVTSTKIEARELNLERIAFNLENAEYEPEQFPGLVYRINEPRVAFLIFSSGKIICTGAQKIEDVHVALKKLKERMKEIGVEIKPVRKKEK